MRYLVVLKAFTGWQRTDKRIYANRKWDQLNMTMLYLQCIVHNRNIKCLRDLIPSHLPMLKNIRKNAEAAAMKKYGVAKGDLRMFVHYQPSFCMSGERS